MGLEAVDSDVVQITWQPLGPRVIAWTEPWITFIPPLTLNDWLVTYAGLPRVPQTISVAAGQIRLVNAAWVNQGLITRVQYTAAAARCTNDVGGVLQDFDLPFPFP